MIICLDEMQQDILRKILQISEQNGGKKRLHFKKAELTSIFEMEYDDIMDIIYSLKITRFIDVPFQNRLQIDIIIYKEMIEEQLEKNKHYVRKYKAWPDESAFIKKTPEGDMFGNDQDIGTQY